MNKLYIFAVGLLLTACSTKDIEIDITNTLDFDRNNELVSVGLNAPKFGKLTDANGEEVAYQVTKGGIVFQANVAANSTSSYKLSVSEPATVVPEPKTAALFLGDRRKDDFAWENDMAAYRMYGPALLPENPSNGVDLWLKHSTEPCVDAMYKQEEDGKPYHIDYGLGIDSYKVGHAAGCGGVAIVANGEVWPGGPFARYEILQEGQLQTVFRLEYDSIQVCDKVWKETITITVNAGAQLNKAEVVFTGEAIEGTQVGGAIFLHDDVGNLTSQKLAHNAEGGEEPAAIGVMSYAEEATSDKGIYSVHESMGIDATTLDFGRNYVSVILPGCENNNTIGGTAVLTKPYQMGETYTYYFGGGWSIREYSTDEAWQTATENTALTILNPLEISVK